MPWACGIPPTPAGTSITRLLSVIANCPSRKNPSRGVVAIQLGLPRPALRNADCDFRDVFLASLINSSLISNGLRVSKLSRRKTSMIASFQNLSGHEHNDDHPPDGEERIADCVRNCVSKRGNLAPGAVAYKAE